MKKVGIIMGSDSDLPVVEKAINVLKIPRYRIESKVLLFSSCLKGIDPSKKGAKTKRE